MTNLKGELKQNLLFTMNYKSLCILHLKSIFVEGYNLRFVGRILNNSEVSKKLRKRVIEHSNTSKDEKQRVRIDCFQNSISKWPYQTRLVMNSEIHCYEELRCLNNSSKGNSFKNIILLAAKINKMIGNMHKRTTNEVNQA